jgi:dienelactone hydrolase
MRRLLPFLALLVLVGCGGATTETGETPTTIAPATTAPATATADVFPADGEERATVVLLHGWNDIAPDDYVPWIDHLNETGVTVVYPRYQRGILSTPGQMLEGTEESIRAGLEQAPPEGPVIAAGYSLGGGFAVVYAANAAAWDVPEPAAVYGVFPAMPPTVPEPFGTVPEVTTVTLLAGDRDQVVGRLGADQLAAAIAPHPTTLDVLASNETTTFDHFAPKRTDALAQEAFWLPLDRIVDRLAPR